MPDLITDDQRDLVSEVREALAKATPGPWRYEPPDGKHGANAWIDADPMPVSDFSGSEADAHLIANAPAWLEALCDQVERLRWLVCSECGDGRGWISVPDPATGDEMQQRCEMCDWRARAEKAEAAVERLRGMAEWWITDDSWRATAAKRILAALDGE